MVKSGLDFFILKFHELTCQANSAFLDRYFCTRQQQLLNGSWNFKINSSMLLSTLIFKSKLFVSRAGIYSTIECVLCGVYVFWGRLMRPLCSKRDLVKAVSLNKIWILVLQSMNSPKRMLIEFFFILFLLFLHLNDFFGCCSNLPRYVFPNLLH